ncbi:L-seryl-tRNA(Sec) selenium transferase [Aliibacillus thermotolerans]|uniref:L-seryl-tRNA(Sec) selenium transferase n=1 Tax=Aliibacillus thermotolerans TaxID=1834418 RepID=A0ABW0U6C5_9BACI|nr:L-seryl-tRNA(Sec) selenium transferase [Aliibacillus thermotolerans]MDA3130058.1 L-seryl-tRNA(Sec) selenium transferase [Aliibacillus thermotolerans]
MKEQLRLLPAVDELLMDPSIKKIKEEFHHPMVLTSWIREEIDRIRKEIRTNALSATISDRETLKLEIIERLKKRAYELTKDHLRSVINATGTVLHTNLGRAILSKKATEKLVQTAASYSNVEYDIESGKRGSRHAIVEELIVETTGAEAAMVVNNNAAAVYFVLHALAQNREVIVSRGQLVEIGGSFRVSSIMEESGAILVEVGTTNKTHPKDYEEAISPNTAMLMKVHTSNFKTIGFTKEVSIEEMATIVRKQKEELLLYEDLGSGAIYDFQQHQIGEEPTVRHVLEAGADIVTFSGDKLLGGPQAGIIAGRKSLIDRLKQHQLARVLRVDKFTLAALEETFKSYLVGKVEDLPVVRMILSEASELLERAQLFQSTLSFSVWKATIQQDVSKVGGGTMPDVTLPTYVIQIDTKDTPAQQVAKFLRLHSTPIVVRTKQGAIQLDVRTILEEEWELVQSALMDAEKNFTF